MLIGVVGKANVGKSTFFKALTLAEVLIANYPFATIEANKGFGHVKLKCADSDFDLKCKPRFGYCDQQYRFVPVEVIDVAGLVPGAHAGKGLGNKFLDDLRQADAFIHVIDCSGGTNEKGEVVEAGSYNPANDIKFLEHELDMWYFQIIKKNWERFAKIVQQEKKEIHKEIAKQLSAMKVSEDLAKKIIKKLAFDAAKPASWTDEQLAELAKELRKATKKMIIAANKLDVPPAPENLEKLKNEFPDYTIIGCSAESELALKEAARNKLIRYVPGEGSFEITGEVNDKQKQGLEFIKKFLEKFGNTGVQKVMNSVVFELLDCIAVYPVATPKLTDKEGNILPDCLLVPRGTTALELAFKIHTDIGKNFIKAINQRNKQTIGKEHVLEHNDVIEIITSK